MLSREEIERAYRDYAHSVFRRALKILGDDQEAKEVVHEIFASLLDRPDQFQKRSMLSTWLYSTTTHAALNRLRNAKNRARLVALNADALAESKSRAATLEDRALVSQILSRAPEPIAQAAIHYYFDQMSHQEIAEVMGCSRRHVGDLLERFVAFARQGEEDSDERSIPA